MNGPDHGAEDFSPQRAFEDMLARSQWWPRNERVSADIRSLEKLVIHARQTVPFYEKRLAPLFTRRGNFDISGWEQVEPISRHDVRENFDALTSKAPPDFVSRVFKATTSGSTGEPLQTLKCNVQTFAATAVGSRFFDWHKVDLTVPLAAIRAVGPGEAPFPDGRIKKSVWGPFWRDVPNRGLWRELAITTEPRDQLDWLCRIGRCYLNTMPNNLRLLLDEAERVTDDRLSIAAVFSLGEMVDSELREACRRVLGCEILDQYSTIECGLIASQCPTSEELHVHSEAFRVETLRDDGTICGVGEEGQVCVTPLFSFAMPLIRYKMSDLITILPPCRCGRSLPLMSITGGRLRQRFRFSDGVVVAPDFRMSKNAALIAATRWQIAQVGEEEIEVRFASAKPDSELNFEALTEIIRTFLRRPVSVKYRRYDTFPVLSSGKHFDYVNELEN